ncbi:MAG: NAD(P)H-dependent oxidoreductase subunit E [Treponema sp.]|nr:NAD(P)H-dependent oxidoreductase subunit E [Treponema sp.]
MSETRELSENAVLEIMARYDNDPQQLIAVLLDIQGASGKNYVDKQWAELVSERLDVPLTKVYDVLTFYAMFSTEPRGAYLIEICESAPCRFGSGAPNGASLRAQELVHWFEAAAGIKIGETSADGIITLARTSCVGACDIGPVAKIGDAVFGNLDEGKVKELVKHCIEGNLKEASQCLN